MNKRTVERDGLKLISWRFDDGRIFHQTQRLVEGWRTKWEHDPAFAARSLEKRFNWKEPHKVIKEAPRGFF